MGKATIASGGTKGLYTVNLDYGSEIIAAQVAEIDAQIADRQADLTEAETAASNAQTALDTATAAVDTAISAYQADPTDANRQAMNAAATEATRLAAEYRNAEARRQSLAAIVLSLQADKSQLQSVRTSETRSAWCVDYTEDATGEVATIEVPGEVGALVIAPGGRAPTASDGRLIARGAQVSYQCYYNAAILPGWQRFVHPYRVGTLSAVDKDANTGTVNLDEAISSANELQVGDAEPVFCAIRYMTCDAQPFEVGDRVIVNMNGPTVIGFESNPKKCNLEVKYIAGTGLQIVGETTQSIPQGGNTEPVEVVPINDDYIFVDWNDGSTDNPRSDTNVQESFAVTARAFSFPDVITLGAVHSSASEGGTGGRPFTVSGSLSTGRTTTFPGYNCDPEAVTASFAALCSTLLGRWTQPGDCDPLSDVVLHTTPICSNSGVWAPGGPDVQYKGEGYLVTNAGLPDAKWTYIETDVVVSTIQCDGSDARSASGSEFRIVSSDWAWFWSRFSPPASVTLTHTATGATRTYTKAEIDETRINYRR